MGGEGDYKDEVVGWHHRLDGHEFEQALGVGDGQGSLVCCSPWSHKESDMTEQLNLTESLTLIQPYNSHTNIFLIGQKIKSK